MDALVLGIGAAVVVGVIVAVVLVVVKKQKGGQESTSREERGAGRQNAGRNRQQGGAAEGRKPAAANKAAAAKKSADAPKQPARAEKAQAKEETPAQADDDAVLETEEAEGEEWDWGSTPAAGTVVDDTKVSVQDVDPLTEFNVYKQFGYVDKAAESLAAYLKNHPEKANDKNLVEELLGLWLEAKKIDEFSDALTQYQELFDKPALAEYVKQGLALDANHLGLRVLAESRLGWSVKKTAAEIGEQTEDAQAAASERPQLGLLSLPNKQADTEAAQQAAAKAARKDLVVGNAPLGKVDDEEKGTVLAFMQPEQSMKLLKGLLKYDVANRYLNKAIRASGKPAALLIDALTMDYKAKNLRSFIEHLWNLYYSLGNGGRQVKERMLGLGYSMGEHPIFGLLETHAGNTAVLREIGIRNGFIEASAAAKKGRHKSLVNEVVDVENEPKTPAERVLKEAEFLLTYGQLDQSMDLLESAIREYPQEAQLYITLFDLYERAEEWGRLGKLVQDLRTKVQTLPEEVVLAMSQLLQRFNNQGAFGR